MNDLPGLTTLALAALGTLAGWLLSLAPALPLSAAAVLALSVLPTGSVPLLLGLSAGYAFGGMLTAIHLEAPDDGGFLLREAASPWLPADETRAGLRLAASGGLTGSLALLVVASLAPGVLAALRQLLLPHLHSVLLLVALASLARGPGRLAAGWVVFGLAGALGFLVLHGGRGSPGDNWSALAPVWAGLLAVPALVRPRAEAAGAPPPDAGWRHLAPGATAGLLGGTLAALFPAVGPGLGSVVADLLPSAGHPRARLAAQGASRAAYHTGAYLFLFLPGLNLARDGAAAGVQAGLSLGPDARAALLAGLGAASLLACGLQLCLGARLARQVRRVPGRLRRVLALAALGGVCLGLGGPLGLAALGVAGVIGLSARAWDAPPAAVLGASLLPAVLNLTGWDAPLTALLCR